jgi:uncharacterized Tic20 family protein
MKSTASISVPAQVPAQAGAQARAGAMPQPPQAPPDAEPQSDFLARSGAVCGYLAAASTSFVLPLAMYLFAPKDAQFLRSHLAQATSAAITTVLYALCAGIIGGLLMLDSVYLGLRVAITAAMFTWLVTFGYLIAAAISAARGRRYRIPACLSAALLPRRPDEGR